MSKTFEGWLKDRPYAHQVPPMTKLWMEDAWQAALRRAAEMLREKCDSTKRLQRINRGNHCADCWQIPPQWCKACQFAHELEREADRG
jgi:hypothetical protein